MFPIQATRKLLLRFGALMVLVAMPDCAHAQTEFVNRAIQESAKPARRESPIARRLRASLLAQKRGTSSSARVQENVPSHPIQNATYSPPRSPSLQTQESTLTLPQSANVGEKFSGGIVLLNEQDDSLEQAQPLMFESADPTAPRNVGPSSYSLESLLAMAVANHPTLGAATASVNATRNEAFQAGLGPNPKLGLFLDEIGNDDDPGLLGFYIQRNIIRGNKLALSRQVKSREATVRENELQIQAIKIETDVRTAFYRLLISQEKNKLSQQLSLSQSESVEQAKKLFESGESPKTDLLQTKLQAQKTSIMVSQTELEVKNAWRQLAVVTGSPQLPFGMVNGSLNEVFEPVSFEECQQHIFALSPELKAAQAEINRIRATVAREQAQQIPDYQTQFTVGKDSATEHFFAGVQLQIPMMICDRNQGNIAAAKSRLVEASHNLEKVKLQLSQRLAKQYGHYQAALLKANMYNSKLIPQAQESLELLTLGYPEEVEVFQILTAQQLIVEFAFEYLDSLNSLWVSRSKIEGLLLEESLNN